jgi:hypothetical protein
MVDTISPSMRRQSVPLFVVARSRGTTAIGESMDHRHANPWSSIASATFRKPAIFAPFT